MKCETKEKILELLKQDVADRKDRMLHLIENELNTGLETRIEEYRAAYKALDDFEGWMEDNAG